MYDDNITNEQNLQFKMSTEESNTINYLDIGINRNKNNTEIRVYKKPTRTDNTIHHCVFTHIPVLTIHLVSMIYLDMLPQHLVCKNELNCEYCNITLARNNKDP